ncbi:MAG: hypothetical protein ACTHU0_23405, partial [Kofleriaceae bacterium]
GEHRELARRMLAPVAVSIEIGDEVIVDRTTRAARGAQLELAVGKHHVMVVTGGASGLTGWVDVPRLGRCRLRADAGKLVCE